jgi:hypothetical protein
MRRHQFVTVLALSAGAFAARSLGAQAPCATTAAVADSAREEVSGVLQSGSQLVTELRQEQNLPKSGPITPVSLVRDRFVCAKLASLFDHDVAPGVSFVVLRVGPLFYAREPDQRRGTGIIADSAYHVLLRLGVPVPSTESVSQAARDRR